jgi:hypothetical protein
MPKYTRELLASKPNGESEVITVTFEYQRAEALSQVLRELPRFASEMQEHFWSTRLQ